MHYFCVNVYCTLPPGVSPIAVKYTISYHIEFRKYSSVFSLLS